MSNNFRKTAVLKKNLNSKISYKAKDCTKILGAYLCLNFSRGFALDFLYICLSDFSPDLYFLQTNGIV